MIESFLRRLFVYLPAPMRERARNFMRKRRAASVTSRKERSKVSADEILRKLSAFDLSSDFIIHGSVSSIGKLDCSVPDLVQRWFGMLNFDQQTVICPALPYKTTMAEYLSKAPEFAVHSAPNAMGAISNIVMAMEGARRSLHPTHSCIAFGKDAELYVSGHELDPTPFGKNSPFQKLTERRGKIVMFGVNLNSVTNFHVYEDMLGDRLPFRVYLPEPYLVPCIGPNGDRLLVSTRCHDPRQSALRDCERARPFLQAAGAIRTERVGEAELSVVDARTFSVVLLQMLLEGQSIYGRVSLTPRQREAVMISLDALR